MNLKELNDMLNVDGKRTKVKDPVYNRIMNDSMNVDNRVTSSLANPVELVDDNWLERNTYDGGYDDQLYKHKSVMAKKVEKAKVKRNERNDRLGKILDTGNVYVGSDSSYQKNGVDITERQGKFIGDVVSRLF